MAISAAWAGEVEAISAEANSIGRGETGRAGYRWCDLLAAAVHAGVNCFLFLSLLVVHTALFITPNLVVQNTIPAMVQKFGFRLLRTHPDS